MVFSGSIVSLVTPFTEAGVVDYAAIERLVEEHVQQGTDGIVCCGTTGESPTLSAEEKQEIFRTVIRAAKGRIPIIAGTGTNSTTSSVRATEEAMESGASGALVVVPYYNRPTPEGCIAHFRAVASVGLPVIVYHHPGRTGLHLSAPVLAEICALPGVVALKEASGSIPFAAEVRSLTPTTLLSGDDPLTAAIIELGGSGVISVVANVIPGAWKKFVTLLRAGKKQEAGEVYTQYKRLCEAMVLETNPQCVKYALSLMGKCHPDMRLPLVTPRKETRERIGSALQEVGLIGAEQLAFLMRLCPST
jgi:4-hydroxy-tetrahydrodipicolinate synthase